MNTTLPLKLRSSAWSIGAGLAAAILLATVGTLWESNRKLRLALADEVRKSVQAEEASNNYFYLLDRYPGATRFNTFVPQTLRIPTRLGQPTQITLPVTWKQQQCNLQVEAMGLLSAEKVFLKPTHVACGESIVKVEGAVLGDRAKLAGGRLLTIPLANGEVVPVIELAKDASLEAWLQQ